MARQNSGALAHLGHRESILLGGVGGDGVGEFSEQGSELSHGLSKRN